MGSPHDVKNNLCPLLSGSEKNNPSETYMYHQARRSLRLYIKKLYNYFVKSSTGDINKTLMSFLGKDDIFMKSIGYPVNGNLIIVGNGYPYLHLSACTGCYIITM